MAGRPARVLARSPEVAAGEMGAASTRLVELTDVEQMWLLKRRRAVRVGDRVDEFIDALDLGVMRALSFAIKLKLCEALSPPAQRPEGAPAARRRRAPRAAYCALASGLFPLRWALFVAHPAARTPVFRAAAALLAPFHLFSYPAVALCALRRVGARIPRSLRQVVAVVGRFGQAQRARAAEAHDRRADRPSGPPETPQAVQDAAQAIREIREHAKRELRELAAAASARIHSRFPNLDAPTHANPIDSEAALYTPTHVMEVAVDDREPGFANLGLQPNANPQIVSAAASFEQSNAL